jgi:hypothetical protein
VPEDAEFAIFLLAMDDVVERSIDAVVLEVAGENLDRFRS